MLSEYFIIVIYIWETNCNIDNVLLITWIFVTDFTNAYLNET